MMTFIVIYLGAWLLAMLLLDCQLDFLITYKSKPRILSYGWTIFLTSFFWWLLLPILIYEWIKGNVLYYSIKFAVWKISRKIKNKRIEQFKNELKKL